MTLLLFESPETWLRECRVICLPVATLAGLLNLLAVKVAVGHRMGPNYAGSRLVGKCAWQDYHYRINQVRRAAVRMGEARVRQMISPGHYHSHHGGQTHLSSRSS